MTERRGAITLTLTALLALAPTVARADATDDLDKLLDEGAGLFDAPADAEAALISYPRLLHHGYFRFRHDLFHQAHLGTTQPGVAGSGTSATPAPLTKNAVNSGATGAAEVHVLDDATVGGGNIRLRYRPTLELGPTIRAVATLDVLDNLVLGSTPDLYSGFLPTDVTSTPLAFGADGQLAPTSAGAGQNGVADSIALKEIYGEWEPGFMLLRIGRQAEHWGLGMLMNGGEGLDADGGDYVDRVLLRLRLAGLYFGLAFDSVMSGATNADRARPFAQPLDLGEADDVTQWVLHVFQRPLSAAELDARKAALLDDERPVLDWGLYAALRTQSSRPDPDDATRLVDRSAWALIADLWGRLEAPLSTASFIAEVEAAAVIGGLDAAPGADAARYPERDIRAWGAALQTRYEGESWIFGLDGGAASGSSDPGATGFLFDRNYHVDLLLFREALGTVTNAAYARPFVAFEPLKTTSERVGLRLDLEVASALTPSRTPSGDGFLGAEADLRLYYHGTRELNLDLELGVLLPGPAFDDPAAGLDAELAFTFQTRFALEF